MVGGGGTVVLGFSRWDTQGETNRGVLGGCEDGGCTKVVDEMMVVSSMVVVAQHRQGLNWSFQSSNSDGVFGRQEGETDNFYNAL